MNERVLNKSLPLAIIAMAIMPSNTYFLNTDSPETAKIDSPNFEPDWNRSYFHDKRCY